MGEEYSQAEMEILLKIEKLTEQVSQLRENTNRYVSRDEFESRMKPLERIVYGMVGIILIAVIGALVALVVVK